jgi:cell wall-associated NlpC family hydrolase
MSEPFDHVICVPSTYVRDRPGDLSSVTTQLRMGDRVTVGRRETLEGQAWVAVRYHWGGVAVHQQDVLGSPAQVCCSEGWILDASVCRLLEEADASRGRAAQVRALCAHVFGQPTRKKRPAIAKLPYEAWVRVVDDQPGSDTAATADAATGAGSDWLRLALPDGTLGWMQQGDLALGGLPRLDAVSAFQEARRMLGRPYVWAGATSEGYDCSGLVQMFARRMGVGLPHSSRRMASETFTGIIDIGTSRDLTGDAARDAQDAHARWAEQLQAGDLLFFAMSPASRSCIDRVDHTGLYDTASGGLLHASSSGRPECREEPLWGTSGAGGWASRLVAVRRVHC